MRAKSFRDLLKAGDRVAVSNITGREAAKVSVESQKYCGNIVGGWALGKGGEKIEVPGGESIPVYATVEELMKSLPKKKRPNRIVVYSPPPAVYGEVKEIIENGRETVETLYIITEHVSIEVTAKVAHICRDADIDVIGCNTLGMINSLDGVRAGAVGGDRPAESFRPGKAAIISNSGNMVNTMAAYLQSAGVGTAYGISTGKDVLILTPLKDLLDLARDDENVGLVVLYVEPGGLYEKAALEAAAGTGYPKPIVAYVAGQVLEGRDLSLGHAGAVVEGGGTSARAKMELFDGYFGGKPYDPDKRVKKTKALEDSLGRGIRITTLHHLPRAAALICETLGIERDFEPARRLRLNPWFVDMKGLAKHLPSRLLVQEGSIPEPYSSQVALIARETLGGRPPRRDMRNASHASSNDGETARIYGRPVEEEMGRGSFAETLLLAWTGERPGQRDAELVEKCLIASITNGPGTISAQGAKLSASAGNMPNTAMIASLAAMGTVHGGNGKRGVEYLLRTFRDTGLADPCDRAHGIDLDMLARENVRRFSVAREAAKEAGAEYERVPCLGHPVFRDKEVNYDPRERVIAGYMEENGLYNVFLDYYHRLAAEMKEAGIARNVWAVNLDGAIAAVVLGICWKPLREKRMTIQRASDIAFLLFALGRAAGGAAEFLDHQDHGSPMDMRIPVDECSALTKPREDEEADR